MPLTKFGKLKNLNGGIGKINMTKLKPITVTILAIMLLAFSNEKVKNDLVRANLKGKVKSIIEYDYETAQKDVIIQKAYLNRKREYSYDKKGMELEESMYNSEGILQLKYKYAWETNKKQIQETTYSINGNLSNKTIFEFDEQGNKRDGISYGSINTKYTFKTNTQGEIIEQIISTESAEFLLKFTNNYNSNGDIIEKISYNSDGNISTKSIFTHQEYDKNKNWIKRTEAENGKIISLTERVLEYY